MQKNQRKSDHLHAYSTATIYSFQQKMRLKSILLFTLFSLILFNKNFALGATTDTRKEKNSGTETRLIASFYEKEGTKKLIAGIHFKLNHDWKIYSKEDGGFGMPPQLNFSGSGNYQSHNIIWPQAQTAAEKIGQETIAYSFYKNEVILPIEIEILKNNEPAELKIRLDYGICKDICIPASESFDLKITQDPDEKILAEIQKFYPRELIKTNIQESTKTSSSKGLSYILLLAIIGGALLNIMPCVLPVLSIKLISIINHSDNEISRTRFAFLATILGILLCFAVFAILAIAIKITGNSLGWGFQFQNPYFLIFLIIILTLFSANLLGIFEITFEQFLATILHKKISGIEEKNNGFLSGTFIPNFLSGILAVLLATPCSAPFLGSAISFALTADFSSILLIFFAIGIGFASPYIALIFSPKLIKNLPKPGAWMVKLKRLLAILLIATITWMIYILSHNLGSVPAAIISFLSVLIFTSLRLTSKSLRIIAILFLAATSFALPSDSERYNKPKKYGYARKQKEYDAIWRTFDEAELYRQVSGGKVVLVDITADWCITCKFNKIRILHDKEIMTLLKRGDLIGMRGDITKTNEEIMSFLRKHNRFAIPFNAVYGPNAKNGLLTSELLTKKELLKLIEQAQ